MKYKVVLIEKLLSELSIKTRQPLDHHGFHAMSELISEKPGADIRPQYLYESLFRKIEATRKSRTKELKLQVHKLDTIARYLGYVNFSEFVEQTENPIDPVLQQCVGIYMCYVRGNTETGFILSSPVRIYKKENKVFMELRGPAHQYSGEVVLRNTCVFILLRATSGKEIHHVYQIGRRERPEVLQGIFSGVSTSFDPIGGRLILVRREADYDSLENLRADVKVLKKSKVLEQRRVAEYLSDYSRNNLSIGKSMTYSLDDLGVCD